MLVKHLILFIFLVSAFQKSKSQSLPTKYEQYEFLKWYVKQYDEKGWSDSLIHFEDEYSKLADLYAQQIKFSKADVKYFKRQILSNNKFLRLDKEVINNVAWKKSNDYSKGIWVSMPLFSRNKRIAVINNNTYCGPLCGSYGMEIYIKVKGKWRQSKYTPPKAES